MKNNKFLAILFYLTAIIVFLGPGLLHAEEQHYALSFGWLMIGLVWYVRGCLAQRLYRKELERENY